MSAIFGIAPKHDTYLRNFEVKIPKEAIVEMSVLLHTWTLLNQDKYYYLAY